MQVRQGPGPSPVFQPLWVCKAGFGAAKGCPALPEMNFPIPGRRFEEWVQSYPPLRGFSLQGRRALLLLCYRHVPSGLNAGSWPQNIQHNFFVGKRHFVKFAFLQDQAVCRGGRSPLPKALALPEPTGAGDVNTEGLSKGTFRNRAIIVFVSRLPFVLEVLSARACAGKHLCPPGTRQPEEERGKKEKILCPESFSWQPGKDVEFFSPVFLSCSKGGGWKLKFGSSV